MREVRKDLRGRSPADKLRLRGDSGHRLRLRLHQNPADQGDAGRAAGQLHVALPGAAAGGGGHPGPAPAGGLEPPVRGQGPGGGAGDRAALCEGRRTEPHRLPEGPGQLHGGGQGPGGGGAGDRLLLHRQRRLLPGGQRGGGGAEDLHLRAQPGSQGQGGPADDLRGHRHLRPGQL